MKLVMLAIKIRNNFEYKFTTVKQFGVGTFFERIILMLNKEIIYSFILSNIVQHNIKYMFSILMF